MRKSTLVGLAGLVAALAGVSYWGARPTPRAWSTTSGAALVAFEQGRQAAEKFYHIEAIDHFRAALSLDPEFFAARIMLAESLASSSQNGPAKEETARALETVDPSSLTPGERGLWEIAQLRTQGKYDLVYPALERLAKENPGDPSFSRQLASQALGRGDLDKAAKWAEKTLEVAQNDAMSYNTLGYIEMGRGNFAASEAHFKRYVFIAPDQANPHDSLGELYTVMGRWEDAEQELRRAIEVNPQFFPSWDHLARVAALRGDEAGALSAARRSGEITGVDREQLDSRMAILRGFAALSRGDRDGLIAVARELPSDAVLGDTGLLRAIAASYQGDLAALRQLASAATAAATKSEESGKKGPRPVLALINSMRLKAEGHALEAAQVAGSAEAALNFSIDQAIFKLLLRCQEAEALAAAGERVKAQQVLSTIEAVNPSFPCVETCRQLVGRH
jgi:tetratricopeptide (TPR) repeat protein